MMTFPGHWGKGMGGVGGDGVTGPLLQGYLGTSSCHLGWDYVNLKAVFSPEFSHAHGLFPLEFPLLEQR